MNRHLLLLAFFLLATVPHLMAQVSIHDGTGTDPHSSAMLDVQATGKGVLVPRVDIANLATAAPVTAPAEGLLVYNTNATTGVGYYYWNGTLWTRIVVSGDQGSFWRLSGNSGTSVASDFIGTTDNVSVAFRTDNTERMRLQSGGQLTIGATAAGAKLDVHQTTSTAVSRFTTYGNVPVLEVRRTGGTQASPTATSSTNTVLARIDGQGYNGSGYTGAARIEMATDAAGGTSSDMPGRITFSTTPDGSGTLQERLRISNNGTVRLNAYTTDGFIRATGGDGTLVSGGAVNLTSEVTGVLPVANLPSLAGDVTGAVNANTVGRIQGRDVDATAPTDGQVLKWNDASSAWIPSADANTTYTAMSVAEGIAGTATNSRAMRADRLWQIIQYWAPDVTLTGENYLSLSGQQITANPVNLASSNVTGILPIANGGTGSSTGVWVDLTTDQTAAGVKTWSDQANFSNVLRASNGTAAAPSYSFTNSTNMGMYRAGATDLRMITGGDWRVIIRNDYVRFRSLVHNANGTAAAPSYTFNSSPGTGMWRPGADILALSTAGAERLRIDAAGGVQLNAYTTNGLLKTTSGNGTLAIATGADLPSGSGNYIQNQTTLQTTSDFHISGTGRAVTSFQAPLYTRADAGTVGIRPFSNSTTAIQLQNAAGTSILNVDATNSRVGIGITAPTSLLHVSDRVELSRMGTVGTYDSNQVQQIWSIGRSYNISTVDNDFGGTYGITYAHTNAGTATAKKPIAGWGHQILFTSNGTRNAVISLTNGHGYFAGNVGIGTTAPAQALEVNGRIRVLSAQTELYQSGNRLHVRAENVDGVAQFASYGLYLPLTGHTYNLYMAQGMQLGYSTANPVVSYRNGDLLFSSDATERMRLTAAGSLGVGTTAPGGRLHVVSQDFAARTMIYAHAGNLSVNNPEGASSEVRLGAAWGRPGVYSSAGLNLYTASGQSVMFGNNNVEHMRLTAAGDLGVGTTAPARKFHVVTDGWKGRFSGSDGYIDIGPANSSWAHIYTDRPNFIFNQQVVTIGGGFASYDNADLILRTNTSTERMRILNSNGNVGIATATPGAKLHVADAYPILAGNDGMLKVKSVAITGSGGCCGTEAIALQTSIDNRADDYSIPGYGGDIRHVLALQPQGGFVGVGTTGPNDRLTVVEATANNPSLGVDLTSTTSGYNAMESAISHNGTTFAPSGVFGLGLYNSNAAVRNRGVYGHVNNWRGTGVYGSRTNNGGTNDGWGGLFLSDLGYTGGVYNASDRRLKKDVHEISDALSLISQLRPVRYHYDTDKYPHMGLNTTEEFGFIAQEVAQVIPDITRMKSLPTNGTVEKNLRESLPVEEDSFMMMDYSRLIPLLTQAVKDQQQIIEQLMIRIQALESDK